MWLVVGLGNQGHTYSKTRHNVGYLITEELARRHDLTWSAWKNSRGWFSRKTLAHLAVGELFGSKVMLVRPSAFMNLSGEALQPLIRYHHLDAQRMIVVHDDLDMAPGAVKVKRGGGGDGGHKGIRSIVSCVGSKDFWRIKVGIGRSPQRGGVQKWVLGPLSAAELTALEGDVADQVELRMREIIVAYDKSNSA